MRKSRKNLRGSLFSCRILLPIWFSAMGLGAQVSYGLSLDQFLDEVRTNNADLKASAAAIEGSQAKAAEAEIILAPSVFATLQSADDKKAEKNAFQGDRVRANSATVGAAKTTDFGLSGKLSMSFNQVKLSGVNPAFVPEKDYWETKPSLELSQSLIKNGGGSEIRATRQLLLMQPEVTRLAEKLKTDAKMAEAEMAYWRLALARETVRTTKDNLQRSQKLRDWISAKASQQLADRSDMLQTEAAVRGRQLEYQIALDEEKSAARAVNVLRGKELGHPIEDIMRMTPELLSKIHPPNRNSDDHRADTRLSMISAEIAAANAAIQSEKYRPSLDLFAVVAGNGKDDEMNDATKESTSFKYPSTVVGLRLNAPIGSDVIARHRSAAAAEASAAKQSSEAKKFNENQEWLSLTQSLEESRARLKLAKEIESIQKERSQAERERHRMGRTTLFQVLTAESDEAQAELNLIRMEAEVLRTITQMKMFTNASDNNTGSSK